MQFLESAKLDNLPPEILRQIIIYLIHDPTRPVAFLKSALLPLSSVSKPLRAVSTEFLYGSMDLFEASFGLRHRVLASNTILSLFHGLIDPPVTSFIRSGVRRVLIRDRDCTALRTPEGQMHLSGILNRVENLRSVHFDGHFYRPLPLHTEFEIGKASRLNDTLVNLTFLNCDALSPLFPCFLAPGRWENLTRIHYTNSSDQFHKGCIIYPSPFARFESSKEPIFPYLSIFVFSHGNMLPTQFKHVISFLVLHNSSLDRLSVTLSNQPYFNFNTETHSVQSADILRKQCMQSLWKCLPSLRKLRLLDLNISATRVGYAPDHIIHIPSLRGLNLHNESSWQLLQYYRPQHDKELHPIISFFNHIPSVSIAYTHGTPALDQRSGMPKSPQEKHGTQAAKEWFENASQLSHARNFTHMDVKEGDEVWVLLEGGQREIAVATEAQKQVLRGQVGAWSVCEDTELNCRFV